MSEFAYRTMGSLRLLYREFSSRREGMIFAMDGGLWLHRHVWKGTAMAHLVSTDRALLLYYGHRAGLPAERLQFKALKDPRTAIRQDAWHWDLIGRFLPPPTASDARLIMLVDGSPSPRGR